MEVNDMSDWLSLSNLFYLLGLVIAACLTMVATKYRIVVSEVKEVAAKYHEASKDGKITKEEQQAIAKECMDVMMAVVKMVWKF